MNVPRKAYIFPSGVLAVTGKTLKQIVRKWSLLGIMLVCGIYGLYRWGKEQEEAEKGSLLAGFFGDSMERAYFLIPEYLEAEGTDELYQGVEQLMAGQMPFYRYALLEEDPRLEDEIMAEIIRSREGTDEEQKNIDEESLDYGENALHIEGSMLAELEKENSLHNNRNKGEGADRQGQDTEGQIQSRAVFQAAAYPSYTYDWSENWGYEELVSNFFAVDNSTSLKEEYIDLDKLLDQDLSVNMEAEGPQILIYHTHASEAFADSVPGDAATTIVGAGERLAKLLSEEYGFQVLHHTGIYDEDRSDAYSESLPELEQLLAENPTIQVVIDLHRDEMTGGRRLVMDLQGRPTARFMFFNGLSYTRQNGEISYLENPYIQDNLAFSFQAQVAANEYYPGIARKIYLKAYRYNMHVRPRCMLIELGAQNNTVEEIMNACDPLAHVLAIVLDPIL